MTGDGHRAMAHWRRIGAVGTDRCTLSRASQGWLMVGQASWQDAHGESALTYEVRCDPDWDSLSADIVGRRGGRDIALRLMRHPGGWTLNDVPQPGTEECADLDLSFTPATNLLPVRRLGLTDAVGPVPVRAAWLMPGLDRMSRLEQTYTPLENGRIAYVAPDFSAELTVHPSGFVTRYPDLWDGWVDD